VTTSEASVSIIIVNWNGGELLRRCVESIDQFPPRLPHEIVVVDNASTDESVEWLKRQAATGRLRLIENEANVGFSRANNRAIAETRSAIVFLLNADTEVTAGAIDTLIETVQLHARHGACGPRLVHPDGSLQPSAWPNPPTVWETVIAGTGLWRLIPPRLRGRLLLGGHWDHSTRRAVPMLFGAAFLVKREVIDAIGPLDERLHMYAEDNEWCLRMTRGGWRVIFEPAATVVHHGAQSSLQRWTAPERLRVQLRSSLEFQKRAFSRTRFMAQLAAGCAVSGLQRAWRTVRRTRTDEVAIVFDVYSTALKQSLRRHRPS
jgi:GT2 family glycosyltransferase